VDYGGSCAEFICGNETFLTWSAPEEERSKRRRASGLSGTLVFASTTPVSVLEGFSVFFFLRKVIMRNLNTEELKQVYGGWTDGGCGEGSKSKASASKSGGSKSKDSGSKSNASASKSKGSKC
jgi:hypothetical protein